MPAKLILHSDRLQRNQKLLQQLCRDSGIRFQYTSDQTTDLVADCPQQLSRPVRSVLVPRPIADLNTLRNWYDAKLTERLILAVDHFAHLEISKLAVEFQQTIAVRLQIQSSYTGFGSRPGIDCLMLAQAIDQIPSLIFDGIQINIDPISASDSRDVTSAVGVLNQTAKLLTEHGFPPLTVACNHVDVCQQIPYPVEWICDGAELGQYNFTQRYNVSLEPVKELQATVISRPEHRTAIVDLARDQYSGRNQLQCEPGVKIVRSFNDHCALKLAQEASDLFIGDCVRFWVR